MAKKRSFYIQDASSSKNEGSQSLDEERDHECPLEFMLMDIDNLEV